MADEAQYAQDLRGYATKVREQGAHACHEAEKTGMAWRSWANRLADLVDAMPLAYPPVVLDGGGDSEFVELYGIRTVDRRAMLTHLEEVLAYADAVPAALFRAGKRAFEQSNDLANELDAEAAAAEADAGPDAGAVPGAGGESGD